MLTTRRTLPLFTIVLTIAAALAAPVVWYGCSVSDTSGTGGDDTGTPAGDSGGTENDGGGSGGDSGGGSCASGGPKCAQGSYCDVATDSCLPGCDVNEDCPSGFCNQTTHDCEGGGGDEPPADTGNPTDTGHPVNGGHDTGHPGDTGTPDDGGEDTGPADAGFDAGQKPKSVIIPGQGVDYRPDISTTQQFRVMTDDFGSLDSALGAGTPNADLAWYLSWPNDKIDALFVDTNGDKAANAGDLLNRLILLDGFYGETAGGHGIGTAKAAWSSEVGQADYSSVLDTGDTMDLFFLKGVNILYDSAAKAKGVTIFKPTKVVPGQDIDWQTMTVFGIKASVKSGTSFNQVDSTFGSPDLVSMASSGGVDTETHTYIGTGLSFVHAADAQTDVNITFVAPPYFGKLKGTSLMLGSTHAQVKAYFDKSYQEQTTAMGNGTLYYYEIYTESIGFTYKFGINLGFLYNSSDKVASILVGYPIQQ